MESIGAVKELCKVTDKLEDRINEIEVLSKQLKKHGYNRDSIKSTLSTRSGVSTCSSVRYCTAFLWAQTFMRH